MLRISLILAGLLSALVACAPVPAPNQMGADGKPLPRAYRIRASEQDDVKFRLLDSVNALRAASGAGQLSFDAKLNAAAATHSRDMAVQNRPWHFGSDGSSPIDRVRRVGYTGTMLGENISETYESELETLSAWMEQPDTRNVVLDKQATNIGFDWYQEPNGKLWWTMITGN